jgi:hypothetical protein
VVLKREVGERLVVVNKAGALDSSMRKAHVSPDFRPEYLGNYSRVKVSWRFCG